MKRVLQLVTALLVFGIVRRLARCAITVVRVNVSTNEDEVFKDCDLLRAQATLRWLDENPDATFTDSKALWPCTLQGELPASRDELLTCVLEIIDNHKAAQAASQS